MAPQRWCRWNQGASLLTLVIVRALLICSWSGEVAAAAAGAVLSGFVHHRLRILLPSLSHRRRPGPKLQESGVNGDGSWRKLGSFERLLTRKATSGPSRLSIPHVCVGLVEGSLSISLLPKALLPLVRRHPLLRARITGNGRVVDAPIAGVRAGGDEPEPLQWAPCTMSDESVVARALEVVSLRNARGMSSGRQSQLSAHWQKAFQKALDETDFDLSTGPLWKLRVVTSSGPADGGVEGHGAGGKVEEAALIFTFNHAISDQISCNTIIHELLLSLEQLTSARGSIGSQPSPSQLSALRRPSDAPPFPPSLEAAILGTRSFGPNTLRYLMRQGWLGAIPTTLLPSDHSAALGLPSYARRTICEFRRLRSPELQRLLAACRRRGLTVTSALAAAMLLTSSDFAHEPEDRSLRTYRLLLSLNMRTFSARNLNQNQATLDCALDWTEGAVACAAGAMDYAARVYANSGCKQLSEEAGNQDRFLADFWDLAEGSRRAFLDFVAQGFVSESVLLFDWGMQTVEINDVVEREADNPSSLGRAYTCGVSNMGIFRPQEEGEYGPLRLTGVHYATGHSLTGSLYQLSCGTVRGDLCLTLHFPWPIVTRQTAAAFAESVLRVLQRVALADQQEAARSGPRGAQPSSPLLRKYRTTTIGGCDMSARRWSHCALSMLCVAVTCGVATTAYG